MGCAFLSPLAELAQMTCEPVQNYPQHPTIVAIHRRLHRAALHTARQEQIAREMAHLGWLLNVDVGENRRPQRLQSVRHKMKHSTPLEKTTS